VKQIDLRSLTDDELVDRFAEIARGQDKALLFERLSEFNKLFREMDNVDLELRSRGTRARAALLRLYDDPNAQVRLKAAKRTLGVAPEAARALIEAIARSHISPQSGEAGMTLSNLDKGIFRPD
jgi:hypothetical protein